MSFLLIIFPSLLVFILIAVLTRYFAGLYCETMPWWLCKHHWNLLVSKAVHCDRRHVIGKWIWLCNAVHRMFCFIALCRYFQKLCACRAIWTMVLAWSVSVCLLIWYFSCRVSFSGACTDGCSLQIKPVELVLKSRVLCTLVFCFICQILTSRPHFCTLHQSPALSICFPAMLADLVWPNILF